MSKDYNKTFPIYYIGLDNHIHNAMDCPYYIEYDENYYGRNKHRIFIDNSDGRIGQSTIGFLNIVDLLRHTD